MCIRDRLLCSVVQDGFRTKELETRIEDVFDHISIDQLSDTIQILLKCQSMRSYKDEKNAFDYVIGNHVMLEYYIVSRLLLHFPFFSYSYHQQIPVEKITGLLDNFGNILT